MNLRGIDLNLLTVFEAVYQERSQVRASERLGMTQPAVSNALARLRHLFDDPLFRGRTRGLVPTPRAERLYEDLHRALDGIRGVLVERQAFDPAGCHRPFVVGVSSSSGLLYGPLLYERMQAEAPHARLKVRSIDPEAGVPALLREHRLDLALCHARFEDPQLEKAPYPPPGAESAVVKQRQQQRPGEGLTGGDQQIALIELFLQAGALGFHPRQHPLGRLVEG